MKNRAFHSPWESKFIDYLDGSLSAEEAKAFENALAGDEELRASFQAYQRVVSLERQLGEKEFALGPQFSVKLMEKIEVEGSRGLFIRRLFMGFFRNQRWLTSSVALAATCVLVIVLTKNIPNEQYRAERRPLANEEMQQAPAAPVSVAPAAPTVSSTSTEEASRKQLPVPAEPVGVKKGILPASQGENKSSNAADSVSERMRAIGKALDEGSSRLEAQGETKEKEEASRDVEQVAGVSAAESKPASAPEKKNTSRGFAKISETKEVAVMDSPFISMTSPQAEKQRINPVPPKAWRDGVPGKGGVASLENSGGASMDREQGSDGVPRHDLEVMGYNRRTQAPAAIQPVQKVQLSQNRPSERRQSAEPAMSLPPAPLPQPIPFPIDRMAPIDESGNYKGYEEQPRIRTSEEALSTFSVDVDTASYTNARRYLLGGNLPPKESVRIEEFLNYFHYNYPSQTEKPFNLTYEIAPSPLEKDRLLLLLGIKARESVEVKKTWNLVFLIDTSGSMGPSDRLALIQNGLKVLVSKMGPEDKVAIVTYAGSAGLVLDATSAKESARILSAIEGLSAGGSTNGSGGIELAYQVAERNKISGGVNRVILATDGDFNVGVTSPESLDRLIEEKRKSGITLTTLGVGTGNLKDSRLEQLADKGNGNYFYLDSFQEARRVLGEKIAGTVEVVAKDVKLQIEFNPQYVAQYRLIGYDNRKLAKEDFNNDQIDAGEIGVGHTVTAMYEIVLKDTELAKRLDVEYRYAKSPTPEAKSAVSENFSSELAFLKVRFKEPEANQSKLLEFPIAASAVKEKAEEASSDFRFAAAVQSFASLLRGSKYAGNYGFAEIVKLSESNLGEDKEGLRREFVNLVKNAEALKR